MRTYLDTSVLSAKFDSREPGRQKLTEEFWRSRLLFQCTTSEITWREIHDNPDPDKRRRMLELYDAIKHIPLNEEARKLANDYIARSVFTLNMEDDALHVACASVAECPLILSWNFRHLVNRRRRLLVNLVNNELGYSSVDILTPAEV